MAIWILMQTISTWIVGLRCFFVPPVSKYSTKNEDVSSDTAEFILMEPLSQDKLARVLIDCQFLTRGQSDSDVTLVSYTEPVQRGLELPSFQGGLVPSVFKSSEWPDTGMVCGSQPSFSEEITCMAEALLHSRKEHTRRLQIKECCDRLRALLPNVKDNWIDTASVLEMTVEYMRYLQNSVPEEVLSQVAKLMGENRTGRWWKQTKTPLQPTKPQLKGKERNIKKSKCKKDKNPKAGRFKAKNPKAGYLAANSLGRRILPAVDRSSKLRPTGQPAAPAVMIPDSNPNSAEVLFQDFPAHQYPEGINVTSVPLQMSLYLYMVKSIFHCSRIQGLACSTLPSIPHCSQIQGLACSTLPSIPHCSQIQGLACSTRPSGPDTFQQGVWKVPMPVVLQCFTHKSHFLVGPGYPLCLVRADPLLLVLTATCQKRTHTSVYLSSVTAATQSVLNYQGLLKELNSNGTQA